MSRYWDASFEQDGHTAHDVGDSVSAYDENRLLRILGLDSLDMIDYRDVTAAMFDKVEGKFTLTDLG